MKNIFSLIISVLISISSYGQELPLLKISNNNRYLVTEDNKPFFWLGGTAWELIHRLTKEDIDIYLKDRANKGFTVIQTVVLAELDGLNTPNAYGNKPLIDNDPTKLNNQYFELVDYVINKSEELGLYVGLLPTWGDKFNKRWGVGPEIFNQENAKIFGGLLAKRYHKHNNIIWVLGGDRIPEQAIHFEIINSMAEGIRQTDTNHLITYHPMGGQIASKFFKEEDWMDFDMFQSGHDRKAKEYKYVWDSKKNAPDKPVINGEPRYENIPDRLDTKNPWIWLDDNDVRVAAYWSMTAGAAGFTYGCNDIWQMYSLERHPNLQARTGWKSALSLPGAKQMTFMKNIFEKLPWQSMHNDQTLIVNENPEDASFITSAIGADRDFILAYTPTGNPIKINVSKLSSEKIKAYWFNPRSGELSYIGDFGTSEAVEFSPWARGWGSDFLLILTNSKLD
ncbi:MAG TPA: glycoside hydrolase family 140 protein [Saprospiraceae bacterium]|nr:glycoside hydrolase family 140 protein [Saprospiraceae bacterium]